MATKPNGCGGLLALIAIVFVVGRCVGSDKPAAPPPSPSVAESTAAFALRTDATPSESEVADAVTPTSPAEIPVEIETAPARIGGDGYIDSDGHAVSSPVYAPSAPDGASAQCRDGTYSFSHHRRGTCSRHGGVAEWL